MAKQRLTSPLGVAIFPHINTPNKKFNDSGTYEVTLRLPEVEANELIKQINEFIEDDVASLAIKNKFNLASVRKAESPYRVAKDKKKDVLNGYIDFRIKNNVMCGTGDKQWEFKPFVVDAKTAQWDMKKVIWSGSKIKVAFKPAAYYVRGELGITLRLDGVQVIELVSNERTPESYGFSNESGESVSDTDTAMDHLDFMNQLKNMKGA